MEDALNTVKSSEIQAVEGRKISLPCPLSAPSRDKVYMVLWFKDDAGIPLYSAWQTADPYALNFAHEVK
uniref:Ig-like domain-containing protein n=1 Tax=Anopheles minimus TaxID=112268 RepID=A0A182VTZ4_9DIPT